MILAPTGDALLRRLVALAATAGYEPEIQGPLLVLHGPRAGLDRFGAALTQNLSSGEARAVRVLFLDVDPASATALQVLAPALAAETVATLAARAAHGSLLDALESGAGVHTAFQPIIDIRSGRTTAFEALLRLEHDGRNVPPLEVFRAAAEAGRLRSADAAARRAAVGAATGWIGDRLLFLNLDAAAVEHPSAFDDTDDAVAAAGLERDQVVLETTLGDASERRHVLRVLEHLRARGYGVALDDVTDDDGTLQAIDRIRPDHVKVDRALVHDLPGLHARSSVAAVVGSAHAVGARVAAKGIETAAQLDAVLFVGVDDAQGWQVGQPMRPPSAV